MQSRKSSLLESVVNVAIGCCVSLMGQLLIFPRFGIDISPLENLQIAAWFTALSIARSYVVRRWFNKQILR